MPERTNYISTNICYFLCKLKCFKRVPFLKFLYNVKLKPMYHSCQNKLIYDIILHQLAIKYSTGATSFLHWNVKMG